MFVVGSERTFSVNAFCRVEIGNLAVPPEILRASPQD
jgi:hypothetical protein